jgi:hypothetical protein
LLLLSGEDTEGGQEDGEQKQRSILQAKLTNLAIQIGYGGMAIALATTLVLAIKFSIEKFYFQVVATEC